MTDPNQFFDFFNLYFNEIIGNTVLGVGIGFIIIVIAGLRFNMPQQVIRVFVGLWALVVAFYVNLLILYIVVLLIYGYWFYLALANRMERG